MIDPPPLSGSTGRDRDTALQPDHDPIDEAILVPLSFAWGGRSSGRRQQNHGDGERHPPAHPAEHTSHKPSLSGLAGCDERAPSPDGVRAYGGFFARLRRGDEDERGVALGSGDKAADGVDEGRGQAPGRGGLAQVGGGIQHSRWLARVPEIPQRLRQKPRSAEVQSKRAGLRVRPAPTSSRLSRSDLSTSGAAIMTKCSPSEADRVKAIGAPLP